MTSKAQTSLFTEDKSTSSPEGSPASPTQQQENDLERKMTATSGRKCLEQYEKFSRPTLWQRTFAASLIGTGAWFSTRCRLIWKLKATRSHRFYFQLVPSTLPTGGIESGLLPTITTETGRKTDFKQGGKSMFTGLIEQGLLPTPRSPTNNGIGYAKNSKKGQKESGRFTETRVPNDWQDFPTQPPVCSRNDGLSPELSGITVSKHRTESIKAYGNAIVPQIAYEIFKAIYETHRGATRLK